MSVARSLADGFSRGSLGQVTATKPFAKTVKDDRPHPTGDPRVVRKSVANAKAEGDVEVPLAWKTFTGGQKAGSVMLHITLELAGGTWRVTSANNTNELPR